VEGGGIRRKGRRITAKKLPMRRMLLCERRLKNESFSHPENQTQITVNDQGFARSRQVIRAKQDQDYSIKGEKTISSKGKNSCIP